MCEKQFLGLMQVHFAKDLCNSWSNTQDAHACKMICCVRKVLQIVQNIPMFYLLTLSKNTVAAVPSFGARFGER